MIFPEPGSPISGIIRSSGNTPQSTSSNLSILPDIFPEISACFFSFIRHPCFKSPRDAGLLLRISRRA